MTEARKDLDEASRRDQKRLQLKREESRVMKETENTTKKFEITQELAEKEACVKYLNPSLVTSKLQDS